MTGLIRRCISQDLCDAVLDRTNELVFLGPKLPGLLCGLQRKFDVEASWSD
jgi:hypothetical protein